ncbi:hypothetical protein B0O99DRAFT_503368 [Bisporella sp. PMI_857]|nr:hypothetical protein B0O99DRAFT_682924 [Bisporella sp. PMI_857]KAH8600384.1 hypothetical protein B0O99DRAFT_503368 [Bisporella sp. PMI_857]
MSKITPKNLQYNNAPPPFLARLQAGRSTGPSDFQAVRPTKARDPAEEAEDEPVVFDEPSGETLSRKEWEVRQQDDDAGGKRESREEDNELGKGEGNGKYGERKEEAKVGIGAGRKRKVGRVVGGEEEEGEEQLKDGKGTVKRKIEDERDSVRKKDSSKKVEKSTGGKKAKKVKLSFGDDE